MGTVSLLASISLVVLAPSLLVAEDAKPGLEELKGSWKMTSRDRNGKKLEVEETFVTFEEHRFDTKTHGKSTESGTIEVDANKRPKTYDIIITGDSKESGNTYHGIYEVEGDVLRTCVNTNPAGDRPTEFATKPSSGHQLVVWKRVKPFEKEGTPADRILSFIQQNVVDRKMVTTQWEPKQRDPKTGEEFQRTFTRTSWYSNARKTDFGMIVEYRVTIDWKSFHLDKQGNPKGEPFDRTSYDTKLEITLANYPGHERLRGIFRAIGGTQDDKPREIGPSDYQRATVYLSTNDEGREVLRMDVNGLFPRVSKAAPSGTPRFVDHDFYETLWLEDGRLHRSQLWRDYLVDPQMLQRGWPLTEEKEIYLDSEKER